MAEGPRQGFSNDYATLAHNTTSVGERVGLNYGGATRKISEEVVRCIWFGRHFDTSRLYTEDGARLEIISPGRWNVEGGPDHLDAEILLEGAGRVKGDVEVHVNASDWKRHGHDGQETYRNVCLHVIMWNDVPQNHVNNIAGENLPQLALSKYVTIPPEEVPGLLDDLADYPEKSAYIAGPCCEAVAKTGSETLERILDNAGDERVLSKARRFEEYLDKKPCEQVLYESLMRAMGYKNNVLQFSRLAALVSLEDLRRFIPSDTTSSPGEPTERYVWVQSMLLGAGGILDGWKERHGKNYTRQTNEHVEKLYRLWKATRLKWDKEPMRHDDWHWAGVRPLNQPPRRIAAMSHLLAKGLEGGMFRDLLTIIEECRRNKANPASTVRREIKDYFSGLKDEFWSHYLTPGGKRLKTPAKLIGGERAAIVFINVVLPLFLAYARRNDDLELEAVLHEAYKS
ncbi:MAG: DUF2851 family protein, partial [Candidatus Brocadiales bacterium]